MKREELSKLELSNEVIDKIMAMHGADIEKHKTAVEAMTAEAEALKGQLADAGTQIESFKGMNIDQIKASADEWKAKAESAQAEAAATVLRVNQEHDLERELKDIFKVADLVAVKAHLNSDSIKYNEKDHTFIGLKEQLDPLKEKYGAYFADYQTPPQITAGGNNQSVLGDTIVSAARAAAGLVLPQKEK